MDSVIVIFLTVIWLGMAAIVRALFQKQPWQTLGGDRRKVGMVRALEEVRCALQWILWVYSICVVVVLAGYFEAREIAFLPLWVIVLALSGEVVVRQERMQRLVMNMLFAFSKRYGSYFGWLHSSLKLLEPLAARLSPEYPVFRDRTELSHLVQHHHHVHRVFSSSAQRQMQSLLKVESRTIQAKVISLKKAQMVKLSDTVGPLLLTDLHDSPYMSFPVYDRRRSKIVGVLDQGVAVSHAARGGDVAKLMEERVVFLPYDATYAQALQTFIETSSPISVIIDDDNQPVGVLYVQDILRELFGATEEQNEI